jgi:hypothetical protein
VCNKDIGLFVYDSLAPAGIGVVELYGSDDARLATALSAFDERFAAVPRAWQPPAGMPAT